MESRSQLLETSGHLTVEIMSPEDVFLFKAVAGRTGDIEDMNTLTQTGLDFDTVLEELQTQTELLDEEVFRDPRQRSPDRSGGTVRRHPPVE
jgi:hypothetical protein